MTRRDLSFRIPTTTDYVTEWHEKEANVKRLAPIVRPEDIFDADEGAQDAVAVLSSIRKDHTYA